jgi:glycosyltransferase involved in cell wall biosynthesis
MKIVYLHQYFNTPAMTGGTRSYEMARRLVAAGHEVHVITSDRSPNAGGGWYRTEVEGIDVHWLPVRYDNAMGYAQRIRAFTAYALRAGPRAARLGGDLVFATSTPLTVALPGVYASKRLRVPMVFEVRDLWPDVPIAIGAIRGPVATGLARRLERFAYRNSARIVALSPGMREGVVRTGYPAARVHVIPNISNLELFDPARQDAAGFRARFPWLGGRPLVLYAGTLGKANGVGYLARVAAAALERDPEVRFLVIGGGKEEPLVRQEAARLGVLERNFFMLERLAKQDMPAAFAAATVTTSLFIGLPSLWHNSANKFFDGLASGTPVAINYGGWQAELLRDTGAGVQLDGTDPSAAADALIAAAHDPAYVARAGAAARRLAGERFEADHLAAQLERVLVEARGASAPSSGSAGLGTTTGTVA